MSFVFPEIIETILESVAACKSSNYLVPARIAEADWRIAAPSREFPGELRVTSPRSAELTKLEKGRHRIRHHPLLRFVPRKAKPCLTQAPSFLAHPHPTLCPSLYRQARKWGFR